MIDLATSRRTLLDMFRPLALLLAVFLLPGMLAAQGEPKPDARPLESFLNPDGTLNLDRNFSGSLDPAGWQMQLDGDGRPRFVREKDQGGVLSIPGDEQWDPRFGPPGVDGAIYAMALDGDNVYVGGRFVTVGSTIAYNIAVWNTVSRTWAPVGGGVGGPVYAIAIDGNEVYVGGDFETVGSLVANGIALYDTDRDEWRDLRNGVYWFRPFPYVHDNGYVYSLEIVGDDLFVGGSFNRIGGRNGTQTFGFGRWSRTLRRWFSYGNGIDSGDVNDMVVQGNHLVIGGSFTMDHAPFAQGLVRLDLGTGLFDTLETPVNGVVHSVVEYQGNLVVGGEFSLAGQRTTVMRRSGSGWQSVGRSPSGAVLGLFAHDGKLYAGGSFRQMNGLPANCIAVFNGAAWNAIGLGMGHPDTPSVETLVVAPNGHVISGGEFLSAGTVTAFGGAGWNGAQWYPLVSGPIEESGNGTNGSVYAVEVDGDRVYVAGDFTRVGGVAARRVAWWNTTTNRWQTMGEGIGGEFPLVRALEMHEGNLYAGGIFDSAGGRPARGIARWNVASGAWEPVGGGMDGETPFVFALLSQDDGLYAAGGFTEAGGVPANRIARFDGTAWSALGDGVRGDTTEYVYVNALASNGQLLFAGGAFTRAGGDPALNLAAWDGSGWSTVDTTPVDAPVTALAVGGNGDLYVAGEFIATGSLGADHLARWDGTGWSEVGGGVAGVVEALHVDADGLLYVGGAITAADALPASNIARWDGSEWNTMGRGINGPVYAINGDAMVYIGGRFTFAGELRANNITVWDGEGFSGVGNEPATGIAGIVLAVALHDGELYVGGSFQSVGALRSGNIARWSEDRWLRMGLGMNGPVRAIAIDSAGIVYAGGEFTRAGVDTALGISRWDGQRWTGLGGGVAGDEGYVAALAVDGDDLFVGGNFTSAGGVPANKIARWNLGSRTWHPLGQGVSDVGTNYFVSGMATDRRSLYVVGNFTSMSGTGSRGVARWDLSDETWNALGRGVDDRGYAVAIAEDGDVYVGGDFQFAGPVRAFNIARWDGTRWYGLETPVGDTLRGVNAPVHAVATLGEHLFIGGDFELAGVTTPYKVARWDGRLWHHMGQGIRHPYEHAYVATLVADNDGIWVGGDFRIAGDRASLNIARWHAGNILDVPSTPRPDESRRLAVVPRVFPNPFVSDTRIEFTLYHGADVVLRVVNMLGEPVAEIAGGTRAAGTHSIGFDAAALPPGSYLVEIEVDGSSAATVAVRL